MTGAARAGTPSVSAIALIAAPRPLDGALGYVTIGIGVMDPRLRGDDEQFRLSPTLFRPKLCSKLCGRVGAAVQTEQPHSLKLLQWMMAASLALPVALL